MRPKQTAEIQDKIEGPGSCTKAINEPCRLHPVDCPTCKNRATCQIRADMTTHPDQIKRCRFYEKSQPSPLDQALGLRPSEHRGTHSEMSSKTP